jgi:hypothetical protein
VKLTPDATNHRAVRISDALHELVAALPGCRGVQLVIHTTNSHLSLEADSDGAVRSLCEALGCQVETASVYEGTADETWWLKGFGFDTERSLYVRVDGPHHKQPRPTAPDDETLGGALLAVQDASHAIGGAA